MRKLGAVLLAWLMIAAWPAVADELGCPPSPPPEPAQDWDAVIRSLEAKLAVDKTELPAFASLCPLIRANEGVYASPPGLRLRYWSFKELADFLSRQDPKHAAEQLAQAHQTARRQSEHDCAPVAQLAATTQELATARLHRLPPPTGMTVAAGDGNVSIRLGGAGSGRTNAPSRAGITASVTTDRPLPAGWSVCLGIRPDKVLCAGGPGTTGCSRAVTLPKGPASLSIIGQISDPTGHRDDATVLVTVR
jgi:hypothetical protein